MVEIFSWEGLVVMRLQSSAQSSVTLFFAVQMCKGLFFFVRSSTFDALVSLVWF